MATAGFHSRGGICFLTRGVISGILVSGLFTAAWLTAGAAAVAGGNAAPVEVTGIIEKYRSESEQRVVAVHGRSVLSRLKDEVARNYPSGGVSPGGKGSEREGFRDVRRDQLLGRKLTGVTGTGLNETGYL